MSAPRPEPAEPGVPPRASGVTIGHVHLRVSDLDRSVAFYRQVLGLDVMQVFPGGAAFLSADGYHHHLGLNTWTSAGGPPAPRHAAGLFHVAFRYPDRAAFAAAVARVLAAGVPLTGRADHGVSEAVYLDDPDGNGIELTWDRPPEAWPRDADGRLAMMNAPLDVAALIGDKEQSRS